MTGAQQILDVARTQIGYRESADGSNRFGAAYGMDRVAWCAQFVWWCFGQAGASALIPKTAYTPTLASWYQQRGLTSRQPRPGDLVFYDWPDSVHRIQHVGLVEAVAPSGTLTTIEGNTTTGVAGDQSHGGVVARRSRSQSAVVLFAHPQYDGAAAPAGPAPAGAGVRSASPLTTLQQGMRNDSRVMALQRFLNAYDWQPELPLLPVTGNYLEQTVAVVKAAQAQCGVTGPDANGTIVGPRTSSAFASRGARW